MKVYKYETLDRPDRWCREGLAVSDGRGGLVDTFWQFGSEMHHLTDAEMRTTELVFDTDDFDELDQNRGSGQKMTWEQYRPEDRETITSQHGLSVRYFTRKGAKPDLETKIENATAAHEKALVELQSAQNRVKWARHDLDELIASRIPQDLRP